MGYSEIHAIRQTANTTHNPRNMDLQQVFSVCAIQIYMDELESHYYGSNSRYMWS